MEIKIALTGAMRSGKDTVAELLEQDLLNLNTNIKFEQVAFGDMLKYFAHDIFLESWTGNKPRKLYQEFGQGIREISKKVYGHENVWVNLLAEFIDSKQNEDEEDNKDIRCIVITDLRQPNEYEWCKENGYTIIKVVTDDSTRLERIKEVNDNFNPEDLTHETETYIDSFNEDYYIDNSGTLEELQKAVVAIAMELYSKVLDGDNNG